MRKTTASLLVVSLLMSFSVHALEARSEEAIRDQLAKVKAETDDTALNKDKALIVSRIGSVARTSDASDAAGLSRTLVSSVGPVSVLSIADVIVKAHADLNDSSKVSTTNLDASATAMKASLDAGLEVYARSLGLVSSRIPLDSMSSDGAKAVAKVVLMGQEMAQGRLNAEQVKQYTELMQATHDILKAGQAKTSQEALKKALAQLGYDSDSKIADLLKCRLAAL